MNPAENDEFTAFLLDAADRTRRIGYPPNDMVTMLRTKGGYDTVVGLLGKPSIPRGFGELVSRGHTELTVEALVLESKWIRYFDPLLLDFARKRLRGAEYSWREWSESGEPRTLRSQIEYVLGNYDRAGKSAEGRSDIGTVLRRTMLDHVRALLGTHATGILMKGSVGQGNWARCPWMALFNPLVTQSAQRGYYAVLLFREDMAGAFLCLGQAATEAKKLYKSDAKTSLAARAANFRAMLGSARSAFPLDKIDLVPSSPSNDSAYYQAGNICAKYYPAGSIPDDLSLKNDFIALLKVYDALVLLETTVSNDDEIPSRDQGNPFFEDPSQYRIHKRIERNNALINEVKKKKVPACEACGLSFKEKYGSLGEGYIEAHHLKPLSSLEAVRTQLDPSTDFAVLCANCHRMIHRSAHVGDVEKFKLEHLLASE